jgi:hypothetical protein
VALGIAASYQVVYVLDVGTHGGRLCFGGDVCRYPSVFVLSVFLSASFLSLRCFCISKVSVFDSSRANRAPRWVMALHSLCRCHHVARTCPCLCHACSLACVCTCTQKLHSVANNAGEAAVPRQLLRAQTQNGGSRNLSLAETTGC